MKLLSRITALGAAATVTLAGLGSLAVDTATAAPATDLMFSIYLEGSSNNKALELYNPTAQAVQLSGYTVSLYSNGATTATNTATLTGELPAGGHFLITNSAATLPELLAQSDLASAVTNFNGDDAVVLTKAGVAIDSIGQVGVDPGTQWGTPPTVTVNATLTKKACTADPTTSDAYDPAVDFAGTAVDDVTTLGTFTCGGVTTSPSPTTTTSPTPTTTPTPGEVVTIGSVQGTTDVSPAAGKTVTVEGIVVGSFQGTDQFGGYYVQDAGDGNAASSDGIFVYAPAATALRPAVGDRVRVTGTVAEFFGQTQLNATAAEVVTESAGLPAPVALTLPLADREAVEGMYVTFPAALTILEYFNYGRYGEIVYGTDRQDTPTAVVEPGAAAQALLAENLARRIIVDDTRGNQNPTPAIHPNGDAFTAENYFRGGDTVAGLTGVLSYRNNAFKLQPTQGAQYTATNPRPGVPEVGGNFHVASFNVLNYFTTLTSQNPNARGADTPEEFQRQQTKIVEALAAINADVFGLMEIENNGTAVENLVAALNAKVGAGTYAAVNTGVVGTDAIFQAIIYKRATTALAGSWKAYDPADSKNRPSLLQTFTHKASGQKVNISINHFKSKGSDCLDVGDPDKGDGAGNCNLTRVAMAKAVAAWLATDPTGQAAGRTIIMGDLNSYDHEDPIDALVAAGYTDLEKRFGGEHAYSYVFDGMVGYLDYALADAGANAAVTGTASWHINADEVSLLDYDMSFKQPAEDALWRPDPYRASDHDPVIIGMQFGSGPTPTPTPTVTVTVTAQPTATPTVTTTVTAQPTATPTVTVTAQPTVTPTVTVTAQPTATPTVTQTATTTATTTTTATVTAQPTATPTVTRTATATATTTVTAQPSSTPTVTQTVTAPPSPGATVTVTATPKPGDLYETPGFHYVNGRFWMTVCQPYSAQITRCFTYIWATQVKQVGNSFVQVNGWAFNNLTYLPAPRALWAGNPLAQTGTWTVAGRQWRTECGTALTGGSSCRSFILTSVIEKTPTGYRWAQKWVLNNIVRFSD